MTFALPSPTLSIPCRAAWHLPRRLAGTALLAGAALLAGCAGPRLVESDVRSYSTLATLPSPPTYRIERLPSQQARPEAFGAIEAEAERALARVGLRRDEAQPRLVAQIGAEGGYAVPRDWPYWSSDPFYGRFGWGLGWGGRGWGLGFGADGLFDGPPTLYHRRVSLVLRDAASQQVVYETSAVYEDVWTQDPLIYGVLFDQALSGFPQPPSTERRVRSEVVPQPR
ncbi:protein of unknown function [Oryzisolibacter propanilivorax]|uniref:DUF4136 domain-containing protein n=1 Tax=Oryzisolibacter propanilivorax TaxID=1527607 RepID=A0A1G9S8P2_9BURK|nr:DUF4136 domain-containing protein [Oryzisolibacter propanilivorax]SDM31762.1 protein of unknown function [Oryzisolibacter propanilivorax]